MSEFESAQSWVDAKDIASRTGKVPSSFTTCIRFLRQDAEQNKNQYGQGSRFCLTRLLKTDSFKAPFYFCAKTFFPDALKSTPNLPKNLYTIFKPGDAAIIVSLLYLFRRLRKDSDQEQWEILAKILHTQCDLGGFVGHAIPAIGLGHGILTGAMRNLAMALFLAVDKKLFANYRRSLKRRGLGYDLAEEFKTWGCTHAQVASILSQQLALGSEMGNVIARGFGEDLGRPSDYPREVGSLRAATQWIDSLYFKGSQPDVVYGAQYYPLAKDVEPLLSKAATLTSVGSPYEWLARGKDSISRTLTPDLYAASPATEEEKEPEGTVPEEAKLDTKELEQLED